MDEQMRKTVRKKVKGRSREHTYPVRLSQRERWRREGGREGRGGGWVGRKDKMKKERGSQIRLEAVRAEIKVGKSKVTSRLLLH